MSVENNEMIERYIYEVIRRVPKKQREEIRLELEELISDMMEQEGAELEAVLTKLGDPREFAQKYSGRHNYLIGPEYYGDYCWMMKVFLISALAFHLVSIIFQAVFSPGLLLKLSFYVETVVTNTLVSLFGGFGLLTLIFAVFERYHVRVQIKITREEGWSAEKLRSWTPAKLPPVPDEKARISRGDCIVGIVFTLLFGLLLVFAPEWTAGINAGDGSWKVVSPFNYGAWNVVLPVLVIDIAIELVNEIMKLLAGRYCRKVMISGILSGVAEIFLSVLLLKVLPFWNPNFVRELEEALELKITSHGDLLFYWNDGVISNILLIGITVFTLAEVGVTVYKTCRYNFKE